MIDIRPFFGWRYNPQKVDLSQVLAPPYDVVTKAEQEAYLRRSPYNVFHLELGLDQPEADRYVIAKRHWDTWRREGILLREPKPSLYLYRLRFSWQGKTWLRRGMIALVELFPWEEGLILPHERTFNRVTEDRLRLLRATKAQFSQIFCLYHDPALKSLEILEEEAELLFSVADEEGFSHELSRVAGEAAITEIRKLLRDEKLYIADGHHRYTTALRFMKELEEEYGSRPKRCFHYMMMYLCPFEEPGLLVLPTHRLFEPGLPWPRFRSLWEAWGRFEELSVPKLEEKVAGLLPWEMIIFHDGQAYLFQLSKDKLSHLVADLPEEVRLLPVTIFTRLLVETLGLNEAELKDEGRLVYTPWVETLLQEARGSRVGVVLAKTPVLALEEVARAGLVMPHKSTYFYPKILTGTVFFEIDPQKSPPC